MNYPRLIIDAVLYCPHCGVRHVDELRGGEKWHRAHTTHRCQACRKDFDVYVSGQAADQPGVLADPPNVMVVRSVDVMPSWFQEAMITFQTALCEHSIADPHLVVTVSEIFGLKIGVMPNAPVKLAGPCGYITVRSEKEADK